MKVAVSPDEFIAELRTFDGRRTIVQAMRRSLNRAAKERVTPAIRKNAIDTLPARGGFNTWVAAARVTNVIKYGSRTTKLGIRGSRKSARNKSDLTAIDRGRLRAPNWRKRGWHTQPVKPGWFSDAAAKTDYRGIVDAEIDRVLDEIRRG